MLGKRQRVHQDGPAEERLRNNISDLYLSNDISACRALTLFQDAVDAKAVGCRKLSRVAKNRAGILNKKNIARGLLTHMLRGKGWPELYWTQIPLYCNKTQEPVTCDMPFLLPHEVVAALLSKTPATVLACEDRLDNSIKEHLAKARIEVVGLGTDLCAVVGLWWDGVPMNWDRNQSLECICMSLPGLPGDYRNLRIPLACVPKRNCIRARTLDSMNAVLTDSFKCLARGTRMRSRFDGLAWRKTDRIRRKRAGNPIGIKGLLAEGRGDWMMLKTTFGFPQWNETSGCCIKCNATPANIRDTGLDASWRGHSLSTCDVLRRMMLKGLTIPSIFGAPGFETTCFKEDWLHCADLGVGPDVLGNLFWMLLPRMPGGNRNACASALFVEIREYYKSHPGLPGHLDNLTVSMIKRAGKSPKLKCYGAECRGLIRFAPIASSRWLDRTNPFELAVIHLCETLDACYQCLSHGEIFARDLLAERSRRLAALWVAIEARSEEPFWRVKPKLHQFQHLCETTGSLPTESWTYRDEDFGGTMSRLARSRGGPRSASAVARNVLLKFIARHPVPLIG